MPTNVTPEYRRAEQQYKSARSAEEKVAALREMLRLIPKHKGTEKVQADIKRRLSRLREQEQQEAKRRGFSIHVPREGAAQIALVGAPNSGKTRLAATLGGVELQVADYPYTTQRPQPVIARHEDVPLQLVDLPPISREHTESWVQNIVRNADFALVAVDLGSPDALELAEEVEEVLCGLRVELAGSEPANDPSESVRRVPSLLLGTKLDQASAADTRDALSELYEGRQDLLAVSAATGEGLAALLAELFRRLRLVRVYSKPPHHDPELDRPYVLREGATVRDFAMEVHRELAEQLKFARLWGRGAFDGQRVQRDHVLNDKDVVELHG